MNAIIPVTTTIMVNVSGIRSDSFICGSFYSVIHVETEIHRRAYLIISITPTHGPGFFHQGIFGNQQNGAQMARQVCFNIKRLPPHMEGVVVFRGVTCRDFRRFYPTSMG